MIALFYILHAGAALILTAYVGLALCVMAAL